MPLKDVKLKLIPDLCEMHDSIIQLQDEDFQKAGFVLQTAFLGTVKVGQSDTCSYPRTTCSPVIFLDLNCSCCCDPLAVAALCSRNKFKEKKLLNVIIDNDDQYLQITVFALRYQMYFHMKTASLLVDVVLK